MGAEHTTAAAPRVGRIVVVLDVNVFLDAARLLGSPFSWERLEDAGHDAIAAGVPHPTDPAFDSVLVLLACARGRAGDGAALSVGTSDHINLLVAAKASAAIDHLTDPGLGWSDADAQDLVDELVWGVVDRSNGDSIGHVPVPYGNPPLDHEDGLVYATARDSDDDDAYIDRFCITRDKGFRQAALPGAIVVVSPTDWIVRQRSMERMAIFRQMSNRPR